MHNTIFEWQKLYTPTSKHQQISFKPLARFGQRVYVTVGLATFALTEFAMPVLAGTAKCAPTRYRQPTVRDEDEELRLEAGVSLDDCYEYKADHKTPNTVESEVEMMVDAVSDDSSQTWWSSFTSPTTANDAECIPPATTASSDLADGYYVGKKRKRSPSGGSNSTDKLDLIELSIDMEAILQADASSSPQTKRRDIDMYVDETVQLHKILAPQDDSRNVTSNGASPSQQFGGHGWDTLAESLVSPKTTSDPRATHHSQHDAYAPWEDPASSATIPATNSGGTIFHVASDGTLFKHLAPQGQ